MESSGAGLSPAFAQLRTRIDAAIATFLNDSFEAFQVLSSETSDEFTGAVKNSLAGGKRFRALSSTVGAATAIAIEDGDTGNSEQLLLRAATDSNLALGAALEMYQAAALVHDDVVDRASERRGRPAAHVEFAQHHESNLWSGSSEHFGMSAAILAGDYLLAAGPYTLENAATGDHGIELRRQFELMSGEVAFGQYLDLRASNVPLDSDFLSTDRIVDVVRLKSARYSVAHPVSLGARQAGAPKEVVLKLQRIFEAAGIAFQLRDDDLGVFGDLRATGKSASGDLIEKKRTVLLALTYENAPIQEKTVLREIYAAPEAPTDSQIEQVREIMASHGRERHEAFIAEYRALAQKRLQEANFPPAAEDICHAFINLVVDRKS